MDRRRLLMDGGGGSSGASRIEYLESDGNQYIDTLYKPTRDDIIFASFAITSFNSSTQQGVMGVTGNTMDSHYHIVTNGNNLQLYTPGQGVSVSGATTNTIYDFMCKSEIHICGNNEYGSYDYKGGCNYSFYLFNYRNQSSISQYNGAPMKLYAFKVMRNGTLLIDMIPYKYNGEGCMYDQISGEYFFNNGTGSFTCGPDVPDDYCEEITFYKYNSSNPIKCKRGMTWNEFIDSSYNNIGVCFWYGDLMWSAGDLYITYPQQYRDVIGDDFIIDTFKYTGT